MKIVFKALPITAPPRAVVCCTEVTIPSNSSKLTPASLAEDPTRWIASERSLELTANLASTAASLLTTSVVVRASFVNEFTAAVRASVLETTSRPERRVKIRASLVLLSVSSSPKPCLENSVAAPAASLNEEPVFFATSNN